MSIKEFFRSVSSIKSHDAPFDDHCFTHSNFTLRQVKFTVGKGFIGLEGLEIEKIASHNISRVPDSYIQKRAQRDGPTHHVTFIRYMEYDHVLSKLQNFMNPQAEHIFYPILFPIIMAHGGSITEENKALILAEFFNVYFETVEGGIAWNEIGLGYLEETIKETNIWNEVYFKVIEWQQGLQFRQMMKLTEQQDFHITVGFRERDIFSQRKDCSTILE